MKKILVETNLYKHIEKIQNEALLQSNGQLQEKNRLLRIRIAELETEIEQLKLKVETQEALEERTTHTIE